MTQELTEAERVELMQRWNAIREEAMENDEEDQLAELVRQMREAADARATAAEQERDKAKKEARALRVERTMQEIPMGRTDLLLDFATKQAEEHDVLRKQVADAQESVIATRDVALELQAKLAAAEHEVERLQQTIAHKDEIIGAVALDRLASPSTPSPNTASKALGWMDSEGPVTVAPGKPSTPSPAPSAAVEHCAQCQTPVPIPPGYWPICQACVDATNAKLDAAKAPTAKVVSPRVHPDVLKQAQAAMALLRKLPTAQCPACKCRFDLPDTAEYAGQDHTRSARGEAGAQAASETNEWSASCLGWDSRCPRCGAERNDGHTATCPVAASAPTEET